VGGIIKAGCGDGQSEVHKRGGRWALSGSKMGFCGSTGFHNSTFGWQKRRKNRVFGRFSELGPRGPLRNGFSEAAAGSDGLARRETGTNCRTGFRSQRSLRRRLPGGVAFQAYGHLKCAAYAVLHPHLIRTT
jgi:hypothetical protein